MPKGVYEKTPKMKTGKYKRTPECNAANSKSKKGILRSPEHNAAMSEIITNSKAANAANDARRGVPRPPEVGAKISKSKKGVSNSPEHNAAIKIGMEESGANDKMRGGDDIVTHHYIYDHDDLSLNTVKMTRSDHTSLHNVLRNLGYIVPYINVKGVK